MENTRRSFLKKMTAAGIGTAGLALSFPFFNLEFYVKWANV